MEIRTNRKCGECKENIVLEQGNFIEKKISEKQFTYYHYECYVAKLVNKKRGAIEENEARKIADKLREESRRSANDIIAKNHLFKWIMAHYNLVDLPTYIYTKFDAIFNGSYKGLARGINAEDFLDMLERKWNDLCSLYNYNLSVGKKMDEVGRLNYDIAVILAKSTSYYRWKEQQKRNQISLQEELKKSEYTMVSVNKMVEQNLQKENEEDISIYLEEI